jgi:small GTP-binding protein
MSYRAYKILLIGESSVGKTTIATRLCEDRFMAESRQHTLGIDMFEKDFQIDGEYLKIQLWDTVGQECYDSITTSYYRGGAGIVVVYDITCARSFKMLSKWMNYVETHATADVSMMILGSKTDLDDLREVQYEDGQKYADNFSIGHFYEVSAKSGQNVQEAFESFFREIHRKVVIIIQTLLYWKLYHTAPIYPCSSEFIWYKEFMILL